MTADVVPIKRGPGRPPKPAAPQYLVLRNVEHPIMEQVLNQQAAQGWRLHSFTSAVGGYLCVFER